MPVPVQLHVLAFEGPDPHARAGGVACTGGSSAGLDHMTKPSSRWPNNSGSMCSSPMLLTGDIGG